IPAVKTRPTASIHCRSSQFGPTIEDTAVNTIRLHHGASFVAIMTKYRRIINQSSEYKENVSFSEQTGDMTIMLKIHFDCNQTWDFTCAGVRLNFTAGDFVVLKKAAFIEKDVTPVAAVRPKASIYCSSSQFRTTIEDTVLTTIQLLHGPSILGYLTQKGGIINHTSEYKDNISFREKMHDMTIVLKLHFDCNQTFDFTCVGVILNSSSGDHVLLKKASYIEKDVAMTPTASIYCGSSLFGPIRKDTVVEIIQLYHGAAILAHLYEKGRIINQTSEYRENISFSEKTHDMTIVLKIHFDCNQTFDFTCVGVILNNTSGDHVLLKRETLIEKDDLFGTNENQSRETEDSSNSTETEDSSNATETEDSVNSTVIIAGCLGSLFCAASIIAMVYWIYKNFHVPTTAEWSVLVGSNMFQEQLRGQKNECQWIFTINLYDYFNMIFTINLYEYFNMIFTINLYDYFNMIFTINLYDYFNMTFTINLYDYFNMTFTINLYDYFNMIFTINLYDYFNMIFTINLYDYFNMTFTINLYDYFNMTFTINLYDYFNMIFTINLYDYFNMIFTINLYDNFNMIFTINLYDYFNIIFTINLYDYFNMIFTINLYDYFTMIFTINLYDYFNMIFTINLYDFFNMCTSPLLCRITSTSATTTQAWPKAVSER
ncbi:hypothetical protein Btru_077297, partial [Bulinus truncatus]